MITIVFGAPGSGKTSLVAAMLIKTYYAEGDKLLNLCRSKLENINETRSIKITLPAQPPIFSDFEVKFLVDYEKWYTPYFINGYYFGIQNDTMPTQFLYPYSKIYLSEVQRYFDSRQNKTFPRWVSEAFEMHRHYGLDFTMDVQRAALIDKNIRELAKRFIEVVALEHEENAFGAIKQTTFHLRVFDSLAAVTRYLDENEPTYHEEKFIHRGNIFNAFDSYGHFNDFLPPDDKDIIGLPFITQDKEIPPELKMYYRRGEPKEYRAPKKKEETS